MPGQMRRIADPRQHQELRRGKGAAGKDHLAPRGQDFGGIPGSDLDPGRAPVLHDHPQDFGLQPQLQPVGMARLDVQQPLARAVADMAARAKGGDADARDAPVPPAAVIGVGGGSLPVRALVLKGIGDAADRTQQRPSQRQVQKRPDRKGAFRRQPAVPAMPGRVQPGQATQPAPEAGAIAAALDPFEMALHGRGAPAGLAGDRRDLVPVGIVGAHDDHGVMHGAAAKAAQARIKHAAPFSVITPVAILKRIVVVMAHPVVVADIGMFRGECVECRDPHRIRQRHVAFLIAAGRAGIAPGLDHQHFHPRLGQPRRDHGAPGPCADDDVVVGGGRHLTAPSERKSAPPCRRRAGLRQTHGPCSPRNRGISTGRPACRSGRFRAGCAGRRP